MYVLNSNHTVNILITLHTFLNDKSLYDMGQHLWFHHGFGRVLVSLPLTADLFCHSSVLQHVCYHTCVRTSIHHLLFLSRDRAVPISLRACQRGHRYSIYIVNAEERQSSCICTKHKQCITVTRLLLDVGAVVKSQASTAHPLLFSFIHSFHWHVQNATIPCHSQELLPFLSVMYFFLPPFSTNYSPILSHIILPSISWSTSQSCCFQIHI